MGAARAFARLDVMSCDVARLDFQKLRPNDVRVAFITSIMDDDADAEAELASATCLDSVQIQTPALSVCIT